MFIFNSFIENKSLSNKINNKLIQINNDEKKIKIKKQIKIKMFLFTIFPI